jgi:type I site-specific restriction-modification system R (restriction) subunit
MLCLMLPSLVLQEHRLFKDDEITKRIFGDYVSRYDFKRSVDDGATVPLYYENRGEYLGLQNPTINDADTSRYSCRK